jgi:acetate---CoA ligase (ADP-forming)
LAAREQRKPLACFTMVSDGLTPYGLAVRQETPHLPMLQEVDKTLGTIQRAIRLAEQQQAVLARGSTGRGHSSARPVPPLPEASVAAAGSITALDEVRSKELIGWYGVPLLPEAFVADPDEAAGAAVGLGLPVVVKGVAASVTHKSDLGLVALDLRTPQEVTAAAREIWQRAALAGAHLGGLLVAQQADSGLEVVIGARRDPEVGPVVMFGAGGVLLELCDDVAFAPAGLSIDRARELICRTRAGRVLAGYRGGPRYDVDAVAQAIVAVSDFISDVAAIEEIDVNPYRAMAGGQGGFALDCLVTIRGRS